MQTATQLELTPAGLLPIKPLHEPIAVDCNASL